MQPSRQSPRSIEITRLPVVLWQASVELLTKILLKNFHKISRKSRDCEEGIIDRGFGLGLSYIFIRVSQAKAKTGIAKSRDCLAYISGSWTLGWSHDQPETELAHDVVRRCAFAVRLRRMSAAVA